MSRDKRRLAKAIDGAMGWTDRAIAADPAGYVRAFVAMGGAILDARKAQFAEQSRTIPEQPKAGASNA